MLILKGPDVQELLAGREIEIIQAVRSAYETHAQGDSSLPHSTFLRFPENERDRIIALPAYLGGEWGVAGVKWVSSFPGNLDKGLDRASALVVLNSSGTGRPEAILEGSIISAKRTAASAALAAQWLHAGKNVNPVGLIGCGLINFEIARFLRAALPGMYHFILHDLDLARAEQFKAKLQQAFGEVEVEIAKDVKTVLRRSSLVSLATTATTPHIGDISDASPGSAILHVSLRDLTPQVILSCDNVVDDVDHVCRAQTSVHLAEQLTGDRNFIRCALADILMGKASARRDAESIAVFSPFGLGVLDLAVSKIVRDLGLEQGLGTIISSFLPESWIEGNSL
ncbi:MAG: 2,3-diaminopropionate biosynthesis protein SbnB [Blastocatellales bacterium]